MVPGIEIVFKAYLIFWEEKQFTTPNMTETDFATRANVVSRSQQLSLQRLISKLVDRILILG